MNKITEPLAYYRHLLPSYSRSIDTTPEQALEVVEQYLEGCRALSKANSWRYDLNFHLSLDELRTALLAEIAQQQTAARKRSTFKHFNRHGRAVDVFIPLKSAER